MLPVRSSMVSASPYTEIEAHLLIISDTRLRLHFTQTHFTPREHAELSMAFRFRDRALGQEIQEAGSKDHRVADSFTLACTPPLAASTR